MQCELNPSIIQYFSGSDFEMFHVDDYTLFETLSHKEVEFTKNSQLFMLLIRLHYMKGLMTLVNGLKRLTGLQT